jgi:hypothetical protein
MGTPKRLTSTRNPRQVLAAILLGGVNFSFLMQETCVRKPEPFIPPHPIDYSVQSSVEFQKQLQSLVQGHILFNPPDQMVQGEIRHMVVRISRDLTEDLRKNLKGAGKVQIEELQVGDFMSVKVEDRDGGLEVKGSPEEQYLTPREYTQWSYDLKAVKPGETTLLLVVGVRIKFEKGGQEVRYKPVFDKQIFVEVNSLYMFYGFLVKNWQWVATSILIPLVTAFIVIWWRAREDKRKKRIESRIVPPDLDDIAKLR